MRKLTKLDLQGLSETMDLLSTEEQNMYVGAYSNDCFWRCVAFVKSGMNPAGYDSWIDAAAESYAQDYFASVMYSGMGHSGADLANRYLEYYGAGVDIQSGGEYLEEIGLAGTMGWRFLHINNVSLINGFREAGILPAGGIGHTVVIMNGDSNGYLVFEPKNGVKIYVSKAELANSGNVLGYFDRP